MVSFALEINWRGLDLQHSWMKPVDGCRASGNNNDHFRRLRQFGYCQGCIVVVLRQKERAATRLCHVSRAQQHQSLSRQNSHKRISGWRSSYHNHTENLFQDTAVYLFVVVEKLRIREDF